jgi:hypothetical protein
MEDESDNIDSSSLNSETDVEESDEPSPGGDNGFFDLEASESDDSNDEGEDEEEEDDDDDESSGSKKYGLCVRYSFTPFRRLPMELRLRIWEFFCPDLAARSHVFTLNVMSRNIPLAPGPIEVRGDTFLELHTKAIRTVLATHRESRSLALRVFPDTLKIHHGSAMIRFNKDNDIVRIVMPPTRIPLLAHDHPWPLDGFRDTIQHLAIPYVFVSQVGGYMPHLKSIGLLRLLLTFPNLKTIYAWSSDQDVKRKALKWTVSDLTCRYFHEVPPPNLEGVSYLFCWPNPKEHMDDAARKTRDKIAVDKLRDVSAVMRATNGLRQLIPEEHLDPFVDLLAEDELARLDTIGFWQLISFEFREGVERYDRLREQNVSNEWSDSSSESEYSTEVDEYESEGIDDGPINYDSDDAASDGEEVGFDLTAIEGAPEPEFSSLESESSSSDDAVASDPTVPEHPMRIAQRSNRRVISSDSEGDSDEEVVKNPTRSRRSRIILSDDDDEDEEDDEDKDDAGPHTVPTKRTPKARSSQDNSSLDEESDEEDDTTNRPISLVERLQLHRQENPITSPDPDGSSEAEVSGGDYDVHQYADVEEDEGDEWLGCSPRDADSGYGQAMTEDSGEESDEESG